MSDYVPKMGERAVLHSDLVDEITVYVADYRGHFQRVGEYESRRPSAYWFPRTRHSAGDIRLLSPELQAWSWRVICEAKRLHEAGEDMGSLATHELVDNTNRRGMHLAPMGGRESETNEQLAIDV